MRSLRIQDKTIAMRYVLGALLAAAIMLSMLPDLPSSLKPG